MTPDLVDLRPLIQHLLAGARALRERQRWAHRIAFLPTDAQAAAEHADALEGFATQLDRASGRSAAEGEP